MAKEQVFSCNTCGATQSKWSGRCDGCGSWNTMVEEVPLSTGPGAKAARRGATLALTDLATAEPPPPRTQAGVDELDRVLGGGLVAASAILVGGDPGIGKSTLLLQAAARFASNGLKVLYVTGEESAGQVQMRAQRLGLTESPVQLAAHTNLRDILATLDAEQPQLAIIDSIQTMWLDSVESAPGSVSQVRACAHELTAFAKRRGIAVVLVGHVTKEGAIAGPRVVEHMVDTCSTSRATAATSSASCARQEPLRPRRRDRRLRDDRQGPDRGQEPLGPLPRRPGQPRPGSVVFAGIEGTRPILCEIQALVAPSAPGQSRRSVVGWDGGRLAMILAVLDARAGLSFAASTSTSTSRAASGSPSPPPTSPSPWRSSPAKSSARSTHKPPCSGKSASAARSVPSPRPIPG
jgi:DNA repair protein RadA/Sms